MNLCEIDIRKTSSIDSKDSKNSQNQANAFFQLKSTSNMSSNVVKKDKDQTNNYKVIFSMVVGRAALSIVIKHTHTYEKPNNV